MALKPAISRPTRTSKKKPYARWVALRKTAQLLALTAFLVLFVAARRGGWPADLVNFPMRLDPLLAIAAWISSREILRGTLLCMVLVLLALATGRGWCGWLCPLGTVLDFLTPKRRRPVKGTSPGSRQTLTVNGWDGGKREGWRAIKYGLALAILFLALSGNLSLLALDPLTIFFRTLSVGLWPLADAGIMALEMLFLRVPVLSAPTEALDALLRPAILPAEPENFRYGWLLVGLFAGIIGLNWVAPRFWCRYLCPLGGLLGWISKAALVRRTTTDECTGCGLCAPSCPLGCIYPDKNHVSEVSECTLCLECLDACPSSRIKVQARPGASQAPRPAVMSRKEALLGLGAAGIAAATFRLEQEYLPASDYRLRPPGAQEAEFISRCIRCGQCVRACPTTALQPSIVEAGLEGLFTPILVPRLGYCDYSCIACSAACPTGAIPKMDLQTKRQQVIGVAVIQEDRCLAWAENKECIVCEEMCPLPEKAIYLETRAVVDPGGIERNQLLPHVVHQRCIGCGICEYQCPVNGEAAIRVAVAETGRGWRWRGGQPKGRRRSKRSALEPQ